MKLMDTSTLLSLSTNNTKTVLEELKNMLVSAIEHGDDQRLPWTVSGPIKVHNKTLAVIPCHWAAFNSWCVAHKVATAPDLFIEVGVRPIAEAQATTEAPGISNGPKL